MIFLNYSKLTGVVKCCVGATASWSLGCARRQQRLHNSDGFAILTLEENEQNAWYILQTELGRFEAYTNDISNALEATKHQASTTNTAQTIVQQ